MRLAAKIALTAICIPFLAAGRVEAAINSSDLVLSVWDPVLGVSYTRDLGISNASFQAGSGIFSSTTSTSTQTTTTAAFNAGPGNNGAPLNLAADANWALFMSQTNVANLKWTISGLSSGAVYALTTGSNFQAPTSYSGTAAQTYLSAVSALSGTANSAIATAANGNAYLGNLIAANNLGGFPLGNITALLNASQTVSLYLPTSSETTTTTFSNPTGLKPVLGSTTTVNYGPAMYPFVGATWTLRQNGDVSFVPGAPEPSELGLMLSGFGLVVLLAKRTRMRRVRLAA